jgi:hypothetical protein
MSPAVLAAIEALPDMTVNQLREEFQRTFGHATASRHKVWLIRRIAWRMQANEEGGLSERALARAKEIVNEADVRLTPPKGSAGAAVSAVSRTKELKLTETPVVVPGTRLRREWKGTVYSVLVLSDGFEYDGNHYRTLSATARAITGTKWNGYVFFGLKKRSGGS